MLVTLASWAIVALLPLIAYRSLRIPGCAFALVLCMYAMEHVLLQNRTGLPFTGSTINIIVGATAVGAIVAAFFRGELSPFRMQVPVVAAYLLLFYAALSLTWAPSPRKSMDTFAEMVPYIAVIVFIAPLCINSLNNMYVFCLAFMAMGACIGLGLIGSEIKYRAVELMGKGGAMERANPLATGSFGGHLAICTFYFFFRFKISKLQKAAVLGIVALALYIVVQSGSRGQMVALGIACIAWIPLAAKASAKTSSLVTYATMVLFILVGYLFLERLDLMWRFNAEQMHVGAAGRYEMATSLVGVAYRKGVVALLFGLGNSSAYHYIGFYPHVVPLEVFAEEGLIGLLLFCVFVFGVYRNIFQNVMNKRFMLRPECCLFGALFTFELLLSLKQGSLLGQQQMLNFGLCSFYTINFMATKLKLSRRRKTKQNLLQPYSRQLTQHGIS